jgi:hypothetical protein
MGEGEIMQRPVNGRGYGWVEGLRLFQSQRPAENGAKNEGGEGNNEDECSPKSMSAVMVGSPEGAWWKAFEALFISML